MAMLMDDVLPFEIAHPQRPRPEPLVFAWRGGLTREELTWLGHQDLVQRYKDMKRCAARELAAFIFERCKFFDVTDSLKPGVQVQIELEINDVGQFKNWLPRERAEGYREGEKATTARLLKSLPYGMAEAAMEFYE